MRVSLIQMGLSASALILLTALLRLLFGGRLPRRAFVALWDVAALRMLLPFSLSLRVFPRNAPRALLQKAAQAAVPGAQTPLLPAEGANFLPSASAIPVNWLIALLPGILRMIWIAGSVALSAFFLLRYARCLRAFALSLPDEDARTVRFLQRHPLRRRVQARVSDAIASPLSYGVLRPVILLPKAMDRRDDQALCFVLLHELSHIRALDAARKPLLLAALCLHWMNPLSYVLLILASRDMELLCDERVLAAFGSEARRAYALTLLAMEERRNPPFSIASGFSRTAIEERIKAMKQIKPKGVVSLIAASLLVFSSCIAFASGDAAQSPSVATVFDDVVIVKNAPSSASVETVLVAVDSDEDGVYSVAFSNVIEGDGAIEGTPFLSAESWMNVYSKYEPYGLSYDAQRGRLTFDGKLVRYFEDMVPVGDGEGNAGTVCSFPDGEVDVFVQRDLDATIVRDADGSYDPMKVYRIISLREDSQEAFDARTAQREEARSIEVVTAVESAAQTYEIYPKELKEGLAAGAQIVYETATDTVVEGAAQSAGEAAQKTSGITWWTAEEYRAWLAQEREDLQSLVGTGSKGYTPTKGWFEWTQEEVDEALALYEQILSEIENGALYGVTADGGFLTTGLREQKN